MGLFSRFRELAGLQLVLRQISRFAAAFALVSAVVEIGRVTAINSATVTLSLVLVVLGLAAPWGFPEALLACVTGILGLDYFFLPPDGFGIVDPQQWWTMVVFVVTALTGGRLLPGPRNAHWKPLRAGRTVQNLYQLSQAIRICDTERERCSRSRNRSRRLSDSGKSFVMTRSPTYIRFGGCKSTLVEPVSQHGSREPGERWRSEEETERVFRFKLVVSCWVYRL